MVDYAYIADADIKFDIKYNLNISNFKYVTIDNITNTLGGRYPVFRRNGDTFYRQFTLGGMICLDYVPHEESPTDSRGNNTNTGAVEKLKRLNNTVASIQVRSSAKQISYHSGVTAQDQYQRERDFRQALVPYLYNGRPKIIYTPQEGSILGVLTNITLTPDMKIAGQAYTFSATVTELCVDTNDNRNKYNIPESANFNDKYISLYSN